MAEMRARDEAMDSEVPAGTVTFLFTDIEGSTRLLEHLHARYAEVLADQQRIMRDCFARWHGHEIDSQGDSFFVAFSRAADAIRCAIDCQHRLAEWDWPEGDPVRVRMGIHTGEPIVASRNYVGLDVHRAARIASAGHGGQILLSSTVRDLVAHELPEGSELRDLGQHHLKDLSAEVHLYQVVSDGLPSDFPPLKTAGGESPRLSHPSQSTGSDSRRGLLRVAVADDHPLYRDGVRTMIESLPGLEFVGEAEDGTAAIALVERLRPDVLLLDLKMPGGGGMAVLRALEKKQLPTAVIVLSMDETDSSLVEALRAGARGYFLKLAGRAELAQAIASVAAGGMVFGAQPSSAIAAVLDAAHEGGGPARSGNARRARTRRENR
jgi:class 3 adenylate cyclase/DNA-binding NarL/FixJ family response regulator